MNNFFRIPIESTELSIIGHRDKNDTTMLFLQNNPDSHNLEQICAHKHDFETLIDNIKKSNDFECQQCGVRLGSLFTSGVTGNIERFVNTTAKEIYSHTKNVKAHVIDYREVWQQTADQIYKAVQEFQEGKEIKKASIDQQTNFRNFLLGMFTTAANVTMNGKEFGPNVFASQSGPSNFAENKKGLMEFLYELFKDKNGSEEKGIGKNIGAKLLKKYFNVGSAKSLLNILWRKFVFYESNYYNEGVKLGRNYGKEVTVTGKGKVKEYGVLVKLCTFMALIDAVEKTIAKDNKGRMMVNHKDVFGSILSEFDK